MSILSGIGDSRSRRATLAEAMVAVAMCVWLSACGGESAATTSDATDGAAVGDAGSGAQGDAPTSTADVGAMQTNSDAVTPAATDAQVADVGQRTRPVTCIDKLTSIPSFSKICQDTADCALVFHQVDCCGTFVAWGIEKSGKSKFDAAEKICQSLYPGCGCTSQETKTESGGATFDHAKITVICKNNTCSSTL